MQKILLSIVLIIIWEYPVFATDESNFIKVFDYINKNDPTSDYMLNEIIKLVESKFDIQSESFKNGELGQKYYKTIRIIEVRERLKQCYKHFDYNDNRHLTNLLNGLSSSELPRICDSTLTTLGESGIELAKTSNDVAQELSHLNKYNKLSKIQDKIFQKSLENSIYSRTLFLEKYQYKDAGELNVNGIMDSLCKKNRLGGKREDISFDCSKDNNLILKPIVSDSFKSISKVEKKSVTYKEMGVKYICKNGTSRRKDCADIALYTLAKESSQGLSENQVKIFHDNKSVSADINSKIKRLNNKLVDIEKKEKEYRKEIENERIEMKVKYAKQTKKGITKIGRTAFHKLKHLENEEDRSLNLKIRIKREELHGEYLEAYSSLLADGAGDLFQAETIKKAMGEIRRVRNGIVFHSKDIRLENGSSIYKKHEYVTPNDVSKAIEEVFKRTKEQVGKLLHMNRKKEQDTFVHKQLPRKFSSSPRLHIQQKLKSKQLIKNRYKDLKRLVKTNPNILGELLLKNPQFTDEICTIFAKMEEDEKSEKLWDKIFIGTGVGIMAGILIASGLGAPAVVTLALLGSSATSSITAGSYYLARSSKHKSLHRDLVNSLISDPSINILQEIEEEKRKIEKSIVESIIWFGTVPLDLALMIRPIRSLRSIRFDDSNDGMRRFYYRVNKRGEEGDYLYESRRIDDEFGKPYFRRRKSSEKYPSLKEKIKNKAIQARNEIIDPLPIHGHEKVTVQDALTIEKKVLKELKELGVEVKVPTQGKYVTSADNILSEQIKEGLVQVEGQATKVLPKEIDNIYLLDIKKLPTLSNTATGYFTNALKHPEMAEYIKKLSKMKFNDGSVYLTIDPTLGLTNVSAVYRTEGFYQSRFISITPSTKWGEFLHEFQHAEFNNFLLNFPSIRNADVLIKKGGGRSLEKLLDGTIVKAFGRDKIRKLELLLKRGLLSRGTHEALAVDVQLKKLGFKKFIVPHYADEALRMKAYDLKNQATDLLSLTRNNRTLSAKEISKAKRELIESVIGIVAINAARSRPVMAAVAIGLTLTAIYYSEELKSVIGEFNDDTLIMLSAEE